MTNLTRAICVRAQGDIGQIKKMIDKAEVRELNNPIEVMLGGIKVTATPFYLACLMGHMDIVELLLKKVSKNSSAKVDINKACSPQEETPLNAATRKKHNDIVNLLLTQPDIKPSPPRIVNNPPPPQLDISLYVACISGSVAVVKNVLQQSGININQAENDGSTPLQQACELGHFDVVEFLLQQPGIDINKPGKDKRTPLFSAAVKEDTRIANLLLKQEGINVNLSTTNGETPLYRACGAGRLETVKQLLKCQEIQVNAGANNTTPLSVACKMGHTAIVEQLLTHTEIQVNTPAASGATPLYMAAADGRTDIVALLLKHKETNIHIKATNEFTPLFMAFMGGHINIVKLLLKHENLIEDALFTNQTITTVQIACAKGLDMLVEYFLLQPETDVNQVAENNATLLHIACSENHLPVVKTLLRQEKMAINASLDNGVTALHLACMDGNLAMVEAFLQYKDKLAINKMDQCDFTALDYAFLGGKYAIVALLLQQGKVQINKKTLFSVLYKLQGQDRNSAGYHEYLNIIKLLIQQYELDINMMLNGRTILNYAKIYGLTDVVRLINKSAPAPLVAENKEKQKAVIEEIEDEATPQDFTEEEQEELKRELDDCNRQLENHIALMRIKKIWQKSGVELVEIVEEEVIIQEPVKRPYVSCTHDYKHFTHDAIVIDNDNKVASLDGKKLATLEGKKIDAPPLYLGGNKASGYFKARLQGNNGQGDVRIVGAMMRVLYPDGDCPIPNIHEDTTIFVTSVKHSDIYRDPELSHYTTAIKEAIAAKFLLGVQAKTEALRI